MHFLEEYNLRRTHSSTQVIPKELFTSNSEQLKAQVQERLLKLNKYQKPRLDAVAPTKLAIKSHSRLNKGKLMFVPKKESKEIIAFGILRENFNEGYAKVTIIKSFGPVKLQKSLKLILSCVILSMMNYGIVL